MFVYFRGWGSPIYFLNREVNLIFISWAICGYLSLDTSKKGLKLIQEMLDMS